MEAAEWTKDEQEFFTRIDDNPKAVVVVTVFYPDRTQVQGVFSDYAKARAWTDSIATHAGSVLAPYIIDDPEWGNRKAQ